MNANIAAFMATISHSEGTDRAADPYRCCFGFKHTIASLADHPAVTGEWTGEVLQDEICRGAGFAPGCKSTAAGRYQIIRPTWTSIRNSLGLKDFGPDSQDSACIELLSRRGAIDMVVAGNFIEAIVQCRQEWASLPGNAAGQPQRTMAALRDAYLSAGGALA